MLAQELISLGEYGQAARLFARLLRLEPENDRNSIMHTEMLRMAREAEESKKAVSNAGVSSEKRDAAGVRG